MVLFDPRYEIELQVLLNTASTLPRGGGLPAFTANFQIRCRDDLGMVPAKDKEEFVNLLAQILRELDENNDNIRAAYNYPNDFQTYN
jgi:hypothetical protein